jgi:hypothetical protein
LIHRSGLLSARAIITNVIIAYVMILPTAVRSAVDSRSLPRCGNSRSLCCCSTVMQGVAAGWMHNGSVSLGARCSGVGVLLVLVFY